MRTLLRRRNVFVPTGNKIRVANDIYNLLTDLKPWPTEHQLTAPTQLANSKSTPAPSDGAPTVTATSLSPSPTLNPKIAVNTLSTGFNNSAFILQGIFNTYNNDENKFGGLQTENFT